ncbi:CDP-diacylglycerol--glycerol-3-phosphate 3-phosphatidyltransferase [Magnetovibrio sp.]|uniref:CDP-diacylglycerol--glycerol-3-phosphate 3-phosphatidyltransferase n=1 Tax=Magnetovibrio sp. TaxID=2024836 RepID=UPI002F93BB38
MILNVPNVLTVSRILAIPVVLGFIMLGGPLGNWLAFAAYTYACVTDFFDGYLARAWHQQSAFGRFLDPIADKLLVAGVLFMLVGVESISALHILPAAVILCREILVSGLREFLAEAQVGMPVSLLAKWKTTIQMLALGFLIVGDVGPDFGFATTWEIGIYGLWIAAAITIVTGYDYLRAGLRHIAETDAAGGKSTQGK